MRLTGYEEAPHELMLQMSDGKIRIRSVFPDAIRITYTRSKGFRDRESPIVIADGHPAAVRPVAEDENRLAVRLGNITVGIRKDTGAFSYYGPEGELLTKEPDRGGKTLDPTDVIRTVFDGEAQLTVSRSADGVRVNAVNSRQVVDRAAFHTKLEFEFAAGEALYGLGSHEEGMLNLRGHSQYLYQQNLKAVVPAFISTRGYGILYASCSYMTFHDDVYGSYIWSDTDAEMDYYVICGQTFDRIIGTYRKLTGAAPMFPRWFFGYIQSKERYRTQEELVGIVREYRERGIPLDAVVQDWLYWPDKQWGQKSFDRERYPDPAAMMRDIHGMHARLMVSVWPNMAEGSANQKEMKERHHLFGNRSTYDAFDADARALYWRQAKEGLFDYGVDAWWCDSSEPFEDDWKGAVKPEPEQRAMRNTQRAGLYMDPEYLNAYSLAHSRGIYEGQRSACETKRVVNLTRSSYAGQHRYAAVTWSGDVSASFDVLRRQIPAGLSFCAAGEPYWTADIGAFFVRHRDDLWFWNGQYEGGCEDPAYRELYLRWFQYGAFLPVFRSHGTDTPREVWRFGEPGTVFYDTLVKFIRLRYRLMPYIYSLAAMVTFEGYTMLRALPFDFMEDVRTYNINSQYMFGPAFMAAPVTRPLYFGKDGKMPEETPRTVPVYLPSGHIWYDFWTGLKYDGGAAVAADACLEKMPLFVPAGSIIPMGPVEMYAGQRPDAPVELRIYGGADGRFVLYEDEGDNYHYEHGLFAKTLLLWDDRRRMLRMERTGYYEGMPETKKYRIVLVSSGHGTGADETAECEKEVDFSGENTQIAMGQSYADRS